MRKSTCLIRNHAPGAFLFVPGWLPEPDTMNAKHASKDLVTRYLSDKGISDRYAVCRQTIWRWVRNGQFPSPVKINGATRWKLADLERWEAEQEGAA